MQFDAINGISYVTSVARDGRELRHMGGII
jgi:hypothetical protein